MISRTAVLIAAWTLATACGIISTWLFHAIHSQVNAKLPRERQFRVLGATPALYYRVERMHRELYPRSHLRAIMYGVVLLGGVAGVIMLYVAGLIVS